MPIAVLASLLAQYGVPLVQKVFELYQKKGDVTQADFDELLKLASYRSTDALAAAGIEIRDGKVVPLTAPPVTALGGPNTPTEPGGDPPPLGN